MLKFRKKPVVVTAFQYLGHEESRHLVREQVDAPIDELDGLQIWNTDNMAWVAVPNGHWIVRGVNGEYYPCSPEVFDATYEAIEITMPDIGCGTCGDTNLRISATAGLWVVQCSKGHIYQPVPGFEITVHVTKDEDADLT